MKYTIYKMVHNEISLSAPLHFPTIQDLRKFWEDDENLHRSVIFERLPDYEEYPAAFAAVYQDPTQNGSWWVETGWCDEAGEERYQEDHPVPFEKASEALDYMIQVALNPMNS